MPLVRSREVGIAVAGLSLAVALSIGAALLSPDSPSGLPAGSSFSKGADGSAAAFLTLRALGYSVSRSFEPIASLSIDPASAVVILADPIQVPSAGDRRALQSLASAGATVILTGCGAISFLTQTAQPNVPSGERREFRALLSSPLTANVPRISMEARCPHPDLTGRFLALYGDGQTDVVRIARMGRGLVVWWAANTPIANATIETPGHLELLLNAIGAPGRTILWDEFYHGQHRSLYSYAKQTPLPWLGVQLAIVTAAAALMYVRRRAPVIERPIESRVSPLEFVETMGNLYGRVDTAADAVATARARLRRLLSEATGMTTAISDDRLAKAAAARTGASETELTQALSATAAIPPSIAPGDALPLVRRLQACAAAVQRVGG